MANKNNTRIPDQNELSEQFVSASGNNFAGFVTTSINVNKVAPDDQTLEVGGITAFADEETDTWLSEDVIANQIKLLAYKRGQNCEQILEVVTNKLKESEGGTAQPTQPPVPMFDYGVWWQQWSKYWVDVTNSFFQPSQSK